MELRRDFSQPWDQGMPQVGDGSFGGSSIQQGMGSMGSAIGKGLSKKPMQSQYASPAGPPQVGQQHPPQTQTGGANSLGQGLAAAPEVNPATSSIYQSGPASAPASALGNGPQAPTPSGPPPQGGMPGSPSQPKPMQQSYNPMGPVMGKQQDVQKRFQQAQAMGDTATMQYLQQMGFQGQ